ncbi:MAG TPA: hypothetical protein DCP90_07770 [Clostridiales bacterium]|nr:MAG: hypothetical protein A2Y22_01335 [Clostridiales bacterium GWD2_32_59]HAN10496.1 hypothetical protein [Clostridiales bacterium]
MDIDFSKYIGVYGTGYVIKKATLSKNELQVETKIEGNQLIRPTEVKMLENTIFDIASLTKSFTAIIIYKSIEEGLINLDDKVKYIDNRFVNLDDVRIKDLLAHQVELWTNGYLGSANTREEFLSMMYNIQIKSRNKIYVDAHYIVLSLLLEKIYSCPFHQIVDDIIIKKVGMDDTSFKPKDLSRVASTNYEIVNGELIDSIHSGIIHDNKARRASELGMNVGHAGVFSTAADMLKLLVCFIDDKYTLLSKKSIETMLTREDYSDFIKNILNTYATENSIEMPSVLYGINEMYEYITQRCNDKKDLLSKIPFCYNNFGTRYKQPIKEKSELSERVSDNSIIFSGFTGPTFMIDFDRKMIIIVMTNGPHCIVRNSELKQLPKKLIREIYDGESF